MWLIDLANSNPLPHNPDFQQPLGKKNNNKTLWTTEKMLVISIFSFSYKVFYPIKHRL